MTYAIGVYPAMGFTHLIICQLCTAVFIFCTMKVFSQNLHVNVYTLYIHEGSEPSVIKQFSSSKTCRSFYNDKTVRCILDVCLWYLNKSPRFNLFVEKGDKTSSVQLPSLSKVPSALRRVLADLFLYEGQLHWLCEGYRQHENHE